MTYNPNIEGGVISFGWPNSQWSLAGEGYYSNLTWHSSDPKPTESEIDAMAVLYKEYQFLQEVSYYRDNKIAVIVGVDIPDSPEYNSPDITVYLLNDERTNTEVIKKKIAFENDMSLSPVYFETVDNTTGRHGVENYFNGADFVHICRTLESHTQNCFLAYKYIKETNAVTPYTDDSWKNDFDTFLGGL